MNFLFRVDASFQAGSGHVMRCLTLASSLVDRGFEVKFLCRDFPGNLCNFLEAQGFSTFKLNTPREFLNHALANDGDQTAPNYGTSDNKVDKQSSLFIPWQVDAEQTKSLLTTKKLEIDWLIVDNYLIDHRWQEILRPYVRYIMIVDDLANRSHDCDLLLDQNLLANLNTRYNGLVPSDSQLLLGPNYLMLRPEFLAARQKRHFDREPTKIILTFGGVDRNNTTAWVLKALNQLVSHSSLEIMVVLGGGCPHRLEVQALAAQSIHSVTIQQSVTQIAERMAWADLAISAGGFTCYELAYMGVPTMVITIAKHQEKVAQELHHRGMSVYLGAFESLNQNDFIHTTQSLMADPQKQISMSNVGQMYIDGQGTGRVIEKIMNHS
ncbi:UDP-2,4-diacetamido-2,4,6-trideoxy-beta-L-altropyranose hydrolase [Neosynechococcus sphagnicola]|uniref:UDP-2,4-diacetamido-2,4, 6-trideoxy-beta-L-altropyranose hydrolase n=1 Tax=Neosynechococcus sphagnicola TaxID=1501145 RepID=UPI00068D2054|nr:UDP-2,4-diacetamido-2,4,6-trideoxy-beta-L-altropyranose hydrolase [Neosynechococcus sphagnicola]